MKLRGGVSQTVRQFCAYITYPVHLDNARGAQAVAVVFKPTLNMDGQNVSCVCPCDRIDAETTSFASLRYSPDRQ